MCGRFIFDVESNVDNNSISVYSEANHNNNLFRIHMLLLFGIKNLIRKSPFYKNSDSA